MARARNIDLTAIVFNNFTYGRTYNGNLTTRLLRNAIRHKGSSVVEVLLQCTETRRSGWRPSPRRSRTSSDRPPGGRPPYPRVVPAAVTRSTNSRVVIPGLTPIAAAVRLTCESTPSSYTDRPSPMRALSDETVAAAIPR